MIQQKKNEREKSEKREMKNRKKKNRKREKKRKESPDGKVHLSVIMTSETPEKKTHGTPRIKLMNVSSR